MNPISEFRLYLKLRPYLKKLGELTSMPLTLSRFLQILTVLVGILDQVLPYCPEQYKKWVLMATGIITIILHNIAGNNNPDGTPSATHNSTMHQ